ncbi:galectin-9-like isoform X2 [Engraulis encrasicolus]|uniref:galectin-9-like isoform X2 n=1 Tax=Engraulis encrasicolus TaxID=184585 RepID=UPI002FCE94BA
MTRSKWRRQVEEARSRIGMHPKTRHISTAEHNRGAPHNPLATTVNVSGNITSSPSNMQQQSFNNPRIPFTGAIKEGLINGTTITIVGRVLPFTERFQVDFKCGEDRALHFNPRYPLLMNYVVCNTLQGSSWGIEERKSPNPIPLGSGFTLTFMVKPDAYSPVQSAVPTQTAPPMTYVFQSFAPPNAQSAPQQVTVCHPVTHPPCPPRDPGTNFQTYCPTLYQCYGVKAPPPYTPSPTHAVPYKTVLPGGLYPGKSITIQGTPNHYAIRFDINLRFNGGIAFCFNPRFNENTVVRNSLLDNRWGPEERCGGMPFHCGHPFTVMIVCDVACYRIIVNGIQMFTYNHRRGNHEETDILEVTGDVSLSSVQL